MLDTMIFDHVVADAPLFEAVKEAAEAGRITIVTTHVQEDQIAAIPDADKREAILRIPRSIVPTTGFAMGVSRLGMAGLTNEETSATLERIGQRHLKTVKDALIAASASSRADALVTEDNTLRKRIEREGLKVSLLTFEEFRLQVFSL